MNTHALLLALSLTAAACAPVDDTTGPASAADELLLQARPIEALQPLVRDGSFGAAGVSYDCRDAGSVWVPGRLALDGSGRLLLASTGGWPLRVHRLTRGGARDATFGANGVVSLSIPFARLAAIADVTVDGAGRPLVAMSVHYGDDRPRFATARLRADGVADATYGLHGVFAQPYGNDFHAWSATTDPAGRAVLVTSGAVARVTPSGAFDTSFGTFGLGAVSPPGLTQATVLRVGADASRRVLAFGVAIHPLLASVGFIARLTEGGALDTTFGGGGVVLTPGQVSPHAIRVLGDGRVVASMGVYVPGHFGYGLRVLRLTASGAPDAATAGGGSADFLQGATSTSYVDANGYVVFAALPSSVAPAVRVFRALPGGLDASMSRGVEVWGRSIQMITGDATGRIVTLAPQTPEHAAGVTSLVPSPSSLSQLQ